MTAPVLVDAQAAARAIGRPQSTVFRWGQAGAIKRHGKDDRGRWLYDLAQVQAVANQAAVRHDRRSEGKRCTIQRRSGEFCDAPEWDELPFPVCRRHAIELHEAIGRLVDAALGSDSPRSQHGGNTQARVDDPRSVVYYALMPSGRIKIGTTVNLRSRCTGLRITRDRVLATEPGGYSVESERHAQFSAHRHPFEEFDPVPELRDHIQALIDRHGDPFPTATRQSANRSGQPL